MLFKRFVQAAMAALVLTAAQPGSAQQVLKVGSTPTGVPFTFLDTKTNSIQGVMVDLITEIGKDAGFAVQIEPMQFSTLIASLTSNKIDIISAAMFATAARKEVIDFSDPVYTYGEGLLVPKTDTKNYATLEDLKGEVVGAQVGTAFVDALKKTGLFAEVKAYDTIPGHPARREHRPSQGRFRRLPDPRLQPQAGRLSRKFAAGRFLQADHRSAPSRSVSARAIGAARRRSTPRSPSSRRMAPSTRFSTNGGSRQKPLDAAGLQRVM